MTNKKVYAMPFEKVYTCLVAKAERKGRTQAEVNEIIHWLTGWEEAQLSDAAQGSYGDFFRNAPRMNPNRTLITGSICGVKLAEIQEPLMRDIRYLDKLIDELAKGKPMAKILRQPE